MATDVMLIKQFNRFAPADPISDEALSSISQGEMFTATIRRTRNHKHHRKFFALMNLVYQNQKRYATFEHMLNAFKVAIGHYDKQTAHGIEVVIPRSISFARMDQTAFEQFYNKAVEFLLTDVLPRVDRTELESQVLELLGDNYH